jgi:hypothetical protein
LREEAVERALVYRQDDRRLSRLSDHLATIEDLLLLTN